MAAVDGGEVWADDSGGDGPPLVLLHPGAVLGHDGLDHLPPLRDPDLVLATIITTLARVPW